MICVFVRIRCKPGTACELSDASAVREIHSGLCSGRGDFDRLMKPYMPEGQGVGRQGQAPSILHAQSGRSASRTGAGLLE